MSLPSQSIEKLFKDHFPGDEGLLVAPDQREAVVAEIRRRFEGSEWDDSYDRSSWLPEEERERHLYSVTLKDADYHYSSDTFYLGLDDENRLVIQTSYRGRATSVASLEQLGSFALDCQRRVQRRQALKSRRDKVTGFKNSAMKAQLRKMADSENLDFVTEFTPQRVKLWVKVRDDDNNLIYLHFSPKRFQEMLPELPGVIRDLEETYKRGFSFKVTNRRGLPWNPKWIRQ